MKIKKVSRDTRMVFFGQLFSRKNNLAQQTIESQINPNQSIRYSLNQPDLLIHFLNNELIISSFSTKSVSLIQAC